MSKTIIALTAITALFFSSCASIVTKSSYPVNFSSKQSGVTVKVTDTATNMVVHTGAAPTTANLKGGSSFKSKSYKVEALKGGKVVATNVLESKVSGWYIANIVSWGIAGFVIDAANGKMYALPKEYNIGVSHSELPILDYKTLTEEQKANLIQL